MYPIGETKLFKDENQDGDLYIRPPEGFEWIPSLIYGYHSNVNPTSIAWIVENWQYPAAEKVGEEVTQTFDKSYFLPTYVPIEDTHRIVFPLMYPVRLTHQFFIRYSVALEANKTAWVAAIVLERPANVELALREWYAELVNKPLPAGLQNLRDRIDAFRGGL